MPKDCKTCQVSKQNSLFLTGLFDKLHRKTRAPEQSRFGTVIGRKVELNAGLTSESRWRYILKLRMEDGNERSLSVSEELFNKAKDGISGTVVWQGDTVLSFTEKE